MINVLLTRLCAPIFSDRMKVRTISWRRGFGNFSTMMAILNKIVIVVFGRFSREYCVAVYLFARRLWPMIKYRGCYGAMLYLKQCNVSLMAAYGDSQTPRHDLIVPVSLTRSGYPRIIPAFHRRKIRVGDDRADQLVHFYLSLFSLYRIVEMAKKIDKSTFESIVTPCGCIDQVITLAGEVKPFLRDFWSRYAPDVFRIPLVQGMRWKPMWSTLPNTHLWRRRLAVSHAAKPLQEYSRDITTPFPVLFYELGAYGSIISVIHSLGQQASSGILFPKRVRYAYDQMNKIWSGVDLDEFERTTGPLLPVRESFGRQLGPHIMMGRLCQVVQGGGKRRIFAIGNYVNQRLLRPLHDWLMEVLRSIPQDGTFDQTRPLERLRGAKVAHSFDLKAATDRWPLVFMFEIIGVVFDREFASANVNSALGFNVFNVPFVKKPVPVSFLAGQPLGYFSSWPLFALSHHVLIWYAAERCYPGRIFTNYAVLGDDVIITDDNVAREYTALIDRLGIRISYSKSLCSSSGAGEFARRFRVKGLSKDLSPVSSKDLLAFGHLYGLLALSRKMKLSLEVSFRVGGAGYRNMATMHFRRNRRWEKFYRMFALSQWRMNLDSFIGGGTPLNPYLKGYLIHWYITKIYPKDIVVCPESFYLIPERAVFAEYTQLRCWMEEWLRYLAWYCKVITNPEIQFEELFDAPVINHSYKAKRQEETWTRFGSIWRLCDMAVKMGYEWKCESICSDHSVGVYNDCNIRIWRYSVRPVVTPIVIYLPEYSSTNETQFSTLL